MRRIPRQLDEHTLINRIKTLERRITALETRLAGRGGLDPSDPDPEVTAAGTSRQNPQP